MKGFAVSEKRNPVAVDFSGELLFDWDRERIFTEFIHAVIFSSPAFRNDIPAEEMLYHRELLRSLPGGNITIKIVIPLILPSYNGIK